MIPIGDGNQREYINIDRIDGIETDMIPIGDGNCDIVTY